MSNVKHCLLLTVAILLIVGAACAPAPTPTTLVVQTRIVESTRVVEQTVVVERIITATPPPPALPDTFAFGAESDPVCLDPAVALDEYSQRVINQIFEGLVKFEKGTTSIVPGLAQAWTVSDDGKVWTFTLRMGVKFQDGTDLVADSIVKNRQRN